MKHIGNNNLFSENQQGFMQKKSCLTNLLETLEEWTSALEEGHGVDVLSLDYQTAFDTVPHQRLLKSLNGTELVGHCSNGKRIS